MATMHHCFTYALILAAALPLSCWAESKAPKSNPASQVGPGQYAPPTQGTVLVDQAEQMRKVWEGPEHTGVGKSTTAGLLAVLKLGEKTGVETVDGGTTTPIVANGIIYVTYFRPSGETLCKNPSSKGKAIQVPKRMLPIAADDILLAINAKTGKKKWKAIEEGKGAHRPGGKRNHFAVSPAYHNGKVFSMGTTGRLYAYDAANGTKLWESNIGEAHQQAEEEKKKALKEQRFVKIRQWQSHLTVVQGILIVPTMNGGIQGHNPDNGKVLWKQDRALSRWSTPAIWTKDNRQYLVACSDRQELRLIEPEKGKVLWTVAVGPNLGTLTVAREHVILNVKPAKEKRDPSRYGAYRLSTEKPKLAWQLPDEPKKYSHTWWLDSGGRRWLATRNGIVYLIINPPKEAMAPYRLVVLQEKDGKILYEKVFQPNDPRCPRGVTMPYLLEDRLMLMVDHAHGARGYGAILYHLKPNGLIHQGRVPFDHYPLTGYEIPIEIPYVNGHMYFRSIRGIACYDLRKAR